MRTIFVIGLILGSAFMAGWFTVNRDEEGTTIRFDREEIRNDTRAAINKGKDYLNDGRQPVNGDQFTSQQAPAFQGQQQFQQQGYGQPQYQQPAYGQPQGQSVPANWAQSNQQNYQPQPQLNQPTGQGGIYMPPAYNANQHANQQPAQQFQPPNYQAQQPQRQF